MQNLIIFITLLFASCTSTDAPPAVEASLTANKNTAPASNITEGKRCIVAIYRAAQFTLYLDGNGAAALIGGTATQIAAQPFEANTGEWIASNTETGDYICVNVRTGATTCKIAGVFGVFTPE